MAHIPLPLFVTRLQAHGAWGEGWTRGEDFASIREGDIRCVAATPVASPESLSATVPVPFKSNHFVNLGRSGSRLTKLNLTTLSIWVDLARD
jgi:hypothetical protein